MSHIKRSGKNWVIPAVTIRSSTIPSSFIIEEHVGLKRKAKRPSFEQAKQQAINFFKDHL